MAAACLLVSPGLQAQESADASPQLLRLRALQDQARATLRKVLPATVGIVAGGNQGSGVIVSPEGHVLSAAHVTESPGRRVRVTLADGRTVTAVSLGVDENGDASLLQLQGPGPWPFAEMGTSSGLQEGTWCLALGHPGGVVSDRPAVVRLGRILRKSRSVLKTDCPIVSGDSGGPLFDLDGKVIGIHSRIRWSPNANYHVPVDLYQETWSRLVAGEAWGRSWTPFMGVELDWSDRPARVAKVMRGFPAHRAGLEPEDLFEAVDGIELRSHDHLLEIIGRKKPGDRISVVVRRAGETKELELELVKRPR